MTNPESLEFLIPLVFGVAILMSIIYANEAYRKAAERKWIERICIGGPL